MSLVAPFPVRTSSALEPGTSHGWASALRPNSDVDSGSPPAESSVAVALIASPAALAPTVVANGASPAASVVTSNEPRNVPPLAEVLRVARVGEHLDPEVGVGGRVELAHDRGLLSGGDGDADLGMVLEVVDAGVQRRRRR